MGDYMDFMSAAVFDGRLRGQLLAHLKNPQLKNDEIIKWFASEGYTVSNEEINKIRKHLLDQEAAHGLDKPIPKY
jgi:hypothetical protein